MTFHGSEMPEVGSRAELGNDISLVELEDEPDSGIYRWRRRAIYNSTGITDGRRRAIYNSTGIIDERGGRLSIIQQEL